MLYAVSNWIYGDESLETTCARLQRFGYDGIELKGEPQSYEPSEVTRLCNAYGLQVLSLAGIYPWPTQDRDLANPDPRVRRKAVAYLNSCVDFAAEVGSPVVIVVPSAVAKTAPVGTFDSEEAWMAAVGDEWKYAVESVREAALRAQARDIRLAVEPINRYETFLLNTCDQALRFIQEVDNEAVGLHLDTFHMNIEEADLGDAFRRGDKKLLNVHIADSNRQGVGHGHTDFRAMMRALVDIGYQGSLALEPLPPVPDPYFAVRVKRFASLRDAYAEESITRLKALEVQARG